MEHPIWEFLTRTYICIDSVLVIQNKRVGEVKCGFFVCVSFRPVLAELPLLFSSLRHYKKVIHIPCITTAHMRKCETYVQILLMFGSLEVTRVLEV
jgi:hypothetical protein